MIETHSVKYGRGNAVLCAALFFPLFACLNLSCSTAPAEAKGSGDAGGTSVAAKDAGPTQLPAEAGGGWGAITETGTMVDYETLGACAGLTVTDNGVSTTTDSTGAFSLTVPAGSTTMAPTVTGPNYTMLLFPASSPAGQTVDYGTNVIPSSSTYGLEQQILQNDQTKALVQIVIQATGACTSVAGGTLQVLEPAGAVVTYFSTANIPSSTLTSFQAVNGPRPVAVVSNIPVGAQLSLAVTHPTCTMVPFPTTSGGMVLTGQVTTKATEPGDVNGAIVLLLQ